MNKEEKTPEEFEPFGKEWRNAVKVMTKDHIIDLFAGVGKERDALLDKLQESETHEMLRREEVKVLMRQNLEQVKQLKVALKEAFKKKFQNHGYHVGKKQYLSMTEKQILELINSTKY